MGRLSKAKWCLLGCLIVFTVLVVGSVFVPDRLANAVKRVANNDFAGKLRALPKQEGYRGDSRVEMVVETVGVSKVGYQPVVILREKGGDRRLPIWIGLLEANAISVTLEQVAVPRPLTPDLLCTTINRIGASVDYIVINDLQDHTFYASITLKANWTQLGIDARPSDAIAVALRTGAPIYVEKAVLDKAGIKPEDKTPEDTGTRVRA